MIIELIVIKIINIKNKRVNIISKLILNSSLYIVDNISNKLLEMSLLEISMIISDYINNTGSSSINDIHYLFLISIYQLIYFR